MRSNTLRLNSGGSLLAMPTSVRVMGMTRLPSDSTDVRGYQGLRESGEPQAAAPGHPGRSGRARAAHHRPHPGTTRAVHLDRHHPTAPRDQLAVQLNRSDRPSRRGYTPHKHTTACSPQLTAPISGERVLTNCGTRARQPADPAEPAHPDGQGRSSPSGGAGSSPWRAQCSPYRGAGNAPLPACTARRWNRA